MIQIWPGSPIQIRAKKQYASYLPCEMRKCHVNLPDNFNQACYYYNHMVSDFILFTNMHSRYDLEAARENLTKQIARHEKEAGHGLDY